MNQPTNSGEISCPQCGAVNANWDANCWLCQQPLHSGAGVLRSAVGDDSIILAQAVEAKTQFGLSTLLIIVTVVCISFGLLTIAPGSIIPLLVIVTPALIRTAVATRLSGGPTSVGDKVAAFSASIGIIVLIWLAGLVAFATACTLIVIGGATQNFNNNIVSLLLLLGVGAAVGAFALVVWLLYKTWPRNKRK